MGFSIHTVTMPDSAGPQYGDRLALASFLNVPFPAAAAGLGTVGSVTAGSGYTFTPTVTPTGGVVTAASAAGVAPVVAVGWPAVLRAVMKVVSAAVPTGGAGSGVVTNDTFLFPFGIELTATASAGAVTSWAVTAAGSLPTSGGLPSVLFPISTSGVGVGVSITPSWGIGSVLIDDSGNYGTIPTGFTVASVDGNGSGGAVAAGAAVAAAKPLFRQLSPAVFTAPNFGVLPSISPAVITAVDMAVAVVSKVQGYAVVAVYPTGPISTSTGLVTGSVTAGTIDALIWA